ncbi:MAG: hypothetical protein FJ095_14590 [Deltaproteobacteria bacterium]|nr:hypothetical protein [Deltaproteobacteria bacterium]
MRGSGNDDERTAVPVPWGSGSAPSVARPRWLDSKPASSSVNLFDSAASFGESVSPPSSDDPPLDARTAAAELSLAAAMAAASAVDLTPVPPAVMPTRDYEGELAALHGEVERLEGELRAVGELPYQLRRQLVEASEPAVVELAVALAERIVGRELALEPGLVARWATAGLTALADEVDLAVVVSEDVFASVPREAWRDPKGQLYTPTVEPRFAPGTCEVRSRRSRIDASAAARIRAVVEALGVTEERVGS